MFSSAIFLLVLLIVPVKGSNTVVSRQAAHDKRYSLDFSNALYQSAMDKCTEEGENARFVYSQADMQGWRISEFSYSYFQLLAR
jgi:hypothetical protein